MENPAQVFAPVFEFAENLATGIITEELSDPAPVLTQFLANQIESAVVAGGIVVDGVTTLGATAAGLPDGIAAAVAAIAEGNPGQAPIEIMNAVLTPAIQFLQRSIPQAEWLLQRPLAVAQALVPVVLESAFSLPIYLGISYVKPLIDTAAAAVGDVLAAVVTGDAGNAINAVQHGVKDVAMRTLDLTGATVAVISSTRQAVKTALQTQPVAPHSEQEQEQEQEQGVAARIQADVATGSRTTISTAVTPKSVRPSLRSIFGDGNKVRPGRALMRSGGNDRAMAQAPAAVAVKSAVTRAKSSPGRLAKVSAAPSGSSGAAASSGDSQE
ncbi:hypothetical protein FR943_23150 [Mycobacterium sp. TNTM28]|uniref:PE-PGRS family protein n=1 Tax=[Mycobacterium] fortunisiensis TaxID=2600579 RepID=A0ABS6KSX6_9MYCO|nr:hypothetical protein [[Mycobacterium] fortunisiensis]